MTSCQRASINVLVGAVVGCRVPIEFISIKHPRVENLLVLVAPLAESHAQLLGLGTFGQAEPLPQPRDDTFATMCR